MSVRHAFALVVALFAMLVARRASAWQESHQTGDDVSVHIDASGGAQVEHLLRWHVVRGPLRWIDLVNVDPAAVVEPDVTVTPDRAAAGAPLSGHAVRRDEHTVRISFDERRALMRGTFVVQVRWHVDLVAAKALARDGATWRLTWSAPVAADGFDAARTVFSLPAAPDAPVAIVADTGAVDPAAVASLRRDPGEDVLELVRPHVARGEAPVWTLRIDPRALSLVADPVLRPSSEATPPKEPDRVGEASMAAALGGLALAFGLVVARRGRAFEAACAERGLAPRALLPLPDGTRALIAGAGMAGAVAFELRDCATAGAACVALATLAAASRPPASKPVARGPGRWTALSPRDAFGEPRDRRPAVSLGVLATLGLVAAAAMAARRWSLEAPWLAVLDAAPLVPLLVTGGASHLPPRGATAIAPWVARAFARLRRMAFLRVDPWARVPTDGGEPDDLRLLVLPRAAVPGVVGIELGLASSSTPAGWRSSPEVLARVLEGSAAAARLARELPADRSVIGRRADERVVRLRPRRPTLGASVGLVRGLAQFLTDRRVRGTRAEGWTGAERRVAPAPVAVAAGCSL